MPMFVKFNAAIYAGAGNILAPDLSLTQRSAEGEQKVQEEKLVFAIPKDLYVLYVLLQGPFSAVKSGFCASFDIEVLDTHVCSSSKKDAWQHTNLKARF